MDDALYAFDGERFSPSALTEGPWSGDAQHGGPVAALLARAVENAPGPDMSTPVQTVRLTVELLRPVPLEPLTVRAEVTRPGRKVQIVEASVYADSGATEVARARALRIRVLPMDVPVARADPPGPPPSPASSAAAPRLGAGPPRTAFAEAVDLHFIKGAWDELGPVTMWTRLRVPVVRGEPATPLQRTAAAADFGNGVSRILEFDTHLFINPDLTVALARVPEGEWIGFDVVTRLSTQGFGQAESLIFDELGPVGRAVQSLLIEER